MSHNYRHTTAQGRDIGSGNDDIAQQGNDASDGQSGGKA